MDKGTSYQEYDFNVAGQRVSIWNGSANLQGQYYLNGQTAAYYAGGAIHFEHKDWLGSERLRTTASGAVEGRYTQLAFGDGAQSSGTDTDDAHYAGLDFDAPTGTSHAKFRELDTGHGRWMSPDPFDGSYQCRNPQSFNRYSYANNRPVSGSDPTGEDDEDGACSDGYGDGGGGDAIPSGYAPTGVNVNDGNTISTDADGNTYISAPGTPPTQPNGDNNEYLPPPDSNSDLGFNGLGLVPYSAGFNNSNSGGGNGGGRASGTAPPRNSRYCGVLANCKTRSQCVGQALHSNAISLGLDAAGFIPGESLAATVAQVGVGTVSTINSAANGDAGGAFGSIAGIKLGVLAPAAKSAGWGIAKSIPVIGAALNVVSTGRDLYGAYSDYQNCSVGH